MTEGATLSLEAFIEENELEFEDHNGNLCEAILAAMLYDGKSQYAIVELIGKPQTTVNYMIKRMSMILQQQVNREDISR